jgi:hypothetical protein
MRYARLIVVAATLAGAVAGCERPYYEAYGYIHASDYYYYPSGRAH